MWLFISAAALCNCLSATYTSWCVCAHVLVQVSRISSSRSDGQLDQVNIGASGSWRITGELNSILFRVCVFVEVKWLTSRCLMWRFCAAIGLFCIGLLNFGILFFFLNSFEVIIHIVGVRLIWSSLRCVNFYFSTFYFDGSFQMWWRMNKKIFLILS